MAEEIVNRLQRRYDFETARLDFSTLVGNRLKLFSDQFPGQELETKVVSVDENRILAESGTRFENIDNLVSNQMVVIQFASRGEVISVKAKFVRSGSGRCYLKLSPQATPLSQRRFVRLDVSIPVKLATITPRAIGQLNLTKLRWMVTDGLNLSGGGMLLKLPSVLERNVYLLMNVEPQRFDFPPLVLGRVCHCYPDQNSQHRVGVEFVVREMARKLFSETVQRQLPSSLFTYTSEKRKAMDLRISNLTINENDLEVRTGDENERES